MAFDISRLSPQDIASLKTQLGMTDVSGRSPVRPRQLHDLRLLPTKDDPRPTFFWSAEGDRHAPDVNRGSEWPKLMFHQQTAEEITVNDAETAATHEATGWGFTAPGTVVLDPVETARRAFAALSPEDQALIRESQKRAKITSLETQLAGLTPDQIDDLLQQTATKVKRTA